MMSTLLKATTMVQWNFYGRMEHGDEKRILNIIHVR